MGDEEPKRELSPNCDSTSDSEGGGGWPWSGSGRGRKPHFSVTSCDVGLKLKIAAVPAARAPRPARPRARAAPSAPARCLTDSSSSSHTCSKCSSSSSSEDELPLRAVTERRRAAAGAGTVSAAGAEATAPPGEGGDAVGGGGAARSSSSSSSSTTSSDSSSSSSDDTDHQAPTALEDASAAVTAAAPTTPAPTAAASAAPAPSATAPAAASPVPASVPPQRSGDGSGVQEQDSSSEMELEPQLVSLVQRAAAAADSDADSEPTQLYANTLLQQFVQQTQLLSTAPAPAPPAPVPAPPAPRRGRGRPRKQPLAEPHEPNVSPDSGILSNHNSPAHSPRAPTPPPLPRTRQVKREAASPRAERKLDMAALDRMLYATDRVLYPPRRRARAPPDRTGAARDSDSDSCSRERDAARRNVLADAYAKRKHVHAQLAALAGRGGAGGGVDPAWRQIDLNRKYKDVVSGYRSDHDAKPYRSCSRLMESGYRSDYGARATSGYRTDRSAAGYRTDHGGRERRRARPARRTRSARDRHYYRHRHFVSEHDVTQLATDTLALLSLAGSDEPPSPPARPARLGAHPPPPPRPPADPFAPAPVFPSLTVKVDDEPSPSDITKPKFSCISVPLPANKIAFTHKFGCPPVAVAAKSTAGNAKNHVSSKNNILKQLSQNVSPKNNKSAKPTVTRNSPKAITNIFEKAIDSYIPNERLSRNAFLYSRKRSHRVRPHTKKHKRGGGVVIAPPKIKLSPSGRVSRPGPATPDRRERHRPSRSHSRHRRRSRSTSRARSLSRAAPVDPASFTVDMDVLLAAFSRCCHIAHAPPAPDKPPEPPPMTVKCVKRGSKKRKAADGGDGGTKRRHKKQSSERDAGAAGDADNTNEHKLPLKKRHYHISSAPRVAPATADATPAPAASVAELHTDDELDAILEPVAEQSELSKKIHEAAEKLKAVNKMVHDLERSLPKTDEKESKLEPDKVASPKPSPSASCVRKAGPVVTPKKRHRLDPDRLVVTSTLDHVVESLARKLAEERPAPAAPPCVVAASAASSDPLECMSLRTLCKSSIPPAQKSEIMTRKKNRLEGLTGNLVSKISPSTATKMLDTLMNDNIRKSIECRIQEKNRANVDVATEATGAGAEAGATGGGARASVIESPVWRTRAPAATAVVVDVDLPTGIFEPSVDVELHIPKSSISLSRVMVDARPSARTRSGAERDADASPARGSDADGSLGRAGRGGSIASVISDKIQEQTSGRSLRPPRRTPVSSPVPVDKKKKNNIIKAGILLSPSKKMEVSTEADNILTVVVEKDTDGTMADLAHDVPEERKLVTPLARKPKRRKAINRTGFPSVKKKKKKTCEATVPGDTRASGDASGCDRVPHEGEATASFVERTHGARASEPADAKPEDVGRERRARLSVISLERLRGEPPAPPAPPARDSDASSSADEDSIPLSLLNAMSEPPRAARRRLKRARGVRSEEREPSSKRRSTRRPRAADADADCSESEPLPPEERECPESAPRASPAPPPGKRNPRLRKKFLVAGLFSDHYKRDGAGSDAEVAQDADGAERSAALLAPPPYCERWVRRRRRHFTLPYDIWWQHHHSESVPSWNYKKIRSNVYHEARPPAEECEAVACHCAPDSGCPEDCINRLVYAECAPALCPCGDRCRNQRIQRHEWAPRLERFMTAHKGWGVRSGARVACGDFVLEYVGEVVSDREFKERMASRYARDTHHYCLHLDGGLVIDGHRMGGEGRFVNHSCRPNCEMQKWTANGTFRMALFALRDIAPGEELTYDYNFSLFNPAEGQVCRCGWEECRGVIGGKSQRVGKPAAVAGGAGASGEARRAGRPRKPAKCSRKSSARAVEVASCGALCGEPAPPPLTARERTLVRERRCFLLRALRTRGARVRAAPAAPAPAPLNPSVTLTRLQVRGAGDSLDKLGRVLRVICQQLHKEVEGAAGGEETWIDEVEGRSPADVARGVRDGRYASVAQFDAELSAALAAGVRARRPQAHALLKAYAACRVQYAERLRAAAPGETLPVTFLHKHKTEEVILCICGLHAEEGLMVQCGGAGCGVWQHARCMRVTDTAAPHRCHACEPRDLDREIPLDERTDDGHRFHLSLVRGELQVRQGDTVYVLRDIPVDERRPDVTRAAGSAGRKRARKKEEVRKHTYRTIGDIAVSELDIFRVERLWRHKDTGERFVYGHHYLRPHETYHEPTRKFFPNEVMRVPLYEAVPIELVMSQCWVLDLNTYCKGRPVGAREEHVYICELRVDRGARLFSKVSRNKYPVCTKSYAFTHFPQRLKISRTYAPHEVSPEYLKGRGGRRGAGVGGAGAASGAAGGAGPRSREQQKERLNAIVSRLASTAAAGAVTPAVTSVTPAVTAVTASVTAVTAAVTAVTTSVTAVTTAAPRRARLKPAS